MHQSVQLVDIFDLVALRFDQLGTARDSERQNNRDPSHQEHQEESQTHGKARLPTYPRREGLTLPTLLSPAHQKIHACLTSEPTLSPALFTFGQQSCPTAGALAASFLRNVEANSQ